MIKPKLWDGKDLKGTWDFTLKLDGVRMLRDSEGNPVSRSGKPLYNLNSVPDDIVDAEVYNTDWETSVSLVRTKDSTPVPRWFVYSLNPLDPGLLRGVHEDPTASLIEKELEKVVSQGYEGLVLRQGDRWLKVKPSENHDVTVTSMVEGTGRNVGRLGALLTPMGKVGTGFTDEEREIIWNDPTTIGSTIEVSCMSLTKGGKFRHPRYIRNRWDK